MKKFIILIALITAFTNCAPSPSTRVVEEPNVKIGIIDTRKIMRESGAAKKTLAIFLKDRDAKMAVFKGKQDEVRALQE